MPGLGTRLRARWRALVDAARIHPRQADDSGDAEAGSQPADTDVVDLRPRVRMPGPAGSEGPPPEWLDYVMAQDPVWIDGGLGLSVRTFDNAVDNATDLARDVSTLTSSSGTRSDGAVPADEGPIAAPRPGRRPRARFVRPSQSPDGSTEPTPVHARVEYPAARTDAPSAAFPLPAHTAAPPRPPRRLLPRHEKAESGPAATDNPVPVAQTGEHISPVPRDPDPPRAAVHDHGPPVWPVAVSTSASRPTSAPAPAPPAPPAPAVIVGSDRTRLTAATARTVAPHLTPTTPAHPHSRASVSLADTYLRPVVDPWVSVNSPAPVVELRRELDDRPAAVDPPVAVRWRAIDVDRLGLEQRAL